MEKIERNEKVNNVYGYVRVSSIDQNEDRQMLAMEKAKVPKKMFILINSTARILIDRIIKNLSKN